MTGKTGARRRTPGVVLAAVYLAVLPACADQGAAPLDLNFTREPLEVTAGLSYTRLWSAGADGRAPLSAHVLTADLRRIEPRIALAHDQVLGRETTSAMVRRLRAVAGVNGGFFIVGEPDWEDFGDPNGFLVLDGQVVSDPVMPRASLGFCDAAEGPPRTLIVTPRVETRLQVSGADGAGDIAVRGRNRGRVDDDLVVYTPRFGPTTPAGGEVEAAVAAGRVIAIGGAGATAIPTDGYVLSATGAHAQRLAAALRVGSGVALHTSVTSLDPSAPDVPLQGCSYISAGPRIVEDGATIEEYGREAFRDAFALQRHPRTAVGYSADGMTLIVVVVDGRQAALSGGMTLPELARLMLAEGAWHAYNLDGGGSSTMVVRDEVVNSPSDGQERPNSDGLMFLARRPGS